MATFENFLPDEDTYDRILKYDLNYTYTMNYSEFYAWNLKCISELSEDDRLWLEGLCRRIEKNSIRLMDLESCAAFHAHGFHYNMDGELCIMMPR